MRAGFLLAGEMSRAALVVSCLVVAGLLAGSGVVRAVDLAPWGYDAKRENFWLVGAPGLLKAHVEGSSARVTIALKPSPEIPDGHQIIGVLDNLLYLFDESGSEIVTISLKAVDLREGGFEVQDRPRWSIQLADGEVPVSVSGNSIWTFKEGFLYPRGLSPSGVRPRNAAAKVAYRPERGEQLLGMGLATKDPMPAGKNPRTWKPTHSVKRMVVSANGGSRLLPHLRKFEPVEGAGVGEARREAGRLLQLTISGLGTWNPCSDALGLIRPLGDGGETPAPAAPDGEAGAAAESD